MMEMLASLRCINSIENIPKGNYTICICDNRSEINEDNITENYEVFVIEKNEIEVIKNICNEINSDYVQILTAGDRVSIDWLYDIEKMNIQILLLALRYIEDQQVNLFIICHQKGYLKMKIQ